MFYDLRQVSQVSIRAGYYLISSIVFRSRAALALERGGASYEMAPWSARTKSLVRVEVRFVPFYVRQV